MVVEGLLGSELKGEGLGLEGVPPLGCYEELLKSMILSGFSLPLQLVWGLGYGGLGRRGAYVLEPGRKSTRKNPFTTAAPTKPTKGGWRLMEPKSP